MSIALPADFIPNMKMKETITDKEPIQAFILTKEHSPRHFQDDKILSWRLWNYSGILDYPLENERE